MLPVELPDPEIVATLQFHVCEGAILKKRTQNSFNKRGGGKVSKTKTQTRTSSKTAMKGSFFPNSTSFTKLIIAFEISTKPRRRSTGTEAAPGIPAASTISGVTKEEEWGENILFTWKNESKHQKSSNSNIFGSRHFRANIFAQKPANMRDFARQLVHRSNQSRQQLFNSCNHVCSIAFHGFGPGQLGRINLIALSSKPNLFFFFFFQQQTCPLVFRSRSTLSIVG